MKTRIITGIIFGVVLISALLYSSVSAAILFFVVATGMLFEYFKTCFSNRAEGFSYLFVGIVISLGFIILSIKHLDDAWTIQILHIIAIAYAIINIFLLITHHKTLICRPLHMFQGFFYISISSFLLIDFLLEVPDSNWVILGIFILIWISDSAAYFVGSQLGKRKLFESVSPNKTWEGFLGAGVFTLIGAYVLSLTPLGLDFSTLMIIGLIVWPLGTLGDLIESSFKRHFKIKDSGAILPGHGGLLDRFDSFIFTIPFILYFLRYLV